jgi:Recombinase
VGGCRVKDKQLEDASEGKPRPGGKRIYGYDRIGWHIVPDEADVIRDIFTLFIAGKSPYWIADHLNADGRLRAGKPWTGRTVRATERQVVIARRAVEVLEGMTGPHARATWTRLQADGERDRLNAVLRFLFAAVVIDESKTKIGTFDYSRISIEQNTF